MEEWRSVSAHPRYEVSSLGRVRNLITGRVLAATPRKNGYISVIFKDGDSQKRYYAHRLVAEAFVRTIGEYCVVNHLNFVRHDNRAENLEVTTTEENVKYSVLAGRMAENGRNAPCGDDHKLSKMSSDAVLELRFLFQNGIRKASLSRVYGIAKTQVANIINRVSWSHI